MLPVRALVLRAWPRVERNQIDLGRNTLEQLHQQLGVIHGIVDALEHHIFEGDAARVRRTRIVAAGLQQFGNRIFAIERHQLVAQLVAHGMQRDRQHDADFVAGADDVRHHARGRQRDTAAGNADAFIVGDDQQRIAHRVEIIERLAHPHHDDIGDEPAAGRRLAIGPVVEAVARHHDLADDFTRREIAHQPLRAGVAERAIQRAADLRGNAERAAVGFRDVDTLDLVRFLETVAARQAQQPFAGAVAGNLLGDHLGARHGEIHVQLGAGVLGDAGHLVKIPGAAEVDPVPQLLHAHLALRRRNADLAQRLGDFGARQADQRRLGRRHIGFERDLLQRRIRRGAGPGRTVSHDIVLGMVVLGMVLGIVHGTSDRPSNGRWKAAKRIDSWDLRKLAPAILRDLVERLRKPLQ